MVFDYYFAINGHRTFLSQKALFVAVFHIKKEGLSLRVFLIIFSPKMGISFLSQKAFLVPVYHIKKEGLSLRVYLTIFTLKMGIKLFCCKRLSL